MIVILLTNYKERCKYNDENIENLKPYLFYYWDEIDFTPEYIKLCHETIHKNAKSFNIIRLNEYNIYEYLPELKKINMNNLMIAQKVDIYRIAILKKYGGIYFDSDIILLKDPIDIYNKLYDYDFIAFKSGMKGLNIPISNWALASRPNSPVMHNILKNQLELVKYGNKIKYHDLGKIIIYKTLMDGNYHYYFMENYYSGNQDINGRFISSYKQFSENNIKLDDRTIFFVMYNSELGDKIKKMSKNDLLKSKLYISKIFRKGLYE
jgi:hypothetical protein